MSIDKIFLTRTVPVHSALEKLAPFTRKCAVTPPLYIVHPITGSVKILHQLAGGLHVRCYGIQKTAQTPDTSVEIMAKFYCRTLTEHQKTGAYHLAGYSYGGLIAFEMARQLQQTGKRVAALIMLDGSPNYVKSQIVATRTGLAPDCSPQHVTAVVESHLLLYFISMYGPVREPELVRIVLEEQPTQEERVAAAVGVTLGTLQINSQARGRWLGLKSKLEQGRLSDKAKVSVSHVAQDVISLRRQQKAVAFLQAAHIAEEYEVTGGYRFEGNIHLMRIQSTPKHCHSLSPDYHLKELCTGTVHVHYVNGEHESMMESPHVESVIAAVNQSLESVMD
ncbi:fatty acid synthase-like [Babylonia areolata]|uniref:fatty acid synthase-like n=1 Tax=Babylonia areolata TaxID=304850 RepID=UPI003FD1FEA6